MNTQRVWIASLFLSGLVCALGSSQSPSAPRPPSLLKASFAKLPIYFVENRGVYPDEVAYYVKGRDKTLFFGRDGITFLLRGPESGWAVKLVFVDASPAVVLRGEDRQTAVFSYFRGPEKDWKTGLPTFAKVVYENLWPGIDLVYRGEGNHLKYEFHVRPGADPGRIRLRYVGATNVTATPSGSLRIETPSRVLEDDPPLAYQDSEGGRTPVDTRYMVSGGAADLSPPTVTFSIGPYDRSRPLILDPAYLVYCGYIGGDGLDWGNAIAVDTSGNAYLTGVVASFHFPVRVGPYLIEFGATDVFVAKVNAAGTRLLYCGYIGGKEDEMASGIAVDPSGNAFVVGTTCSDETSFPVKVGPYLKSAKPQDQEVFVARIADVTLDGPSSIRPGSSAPLLLSAPCEVGLVYQIGSSLGTGPIVLGNRQIHLSPDDLLHVSVSGLLPTVFRVYSGVVPSSGHATASIAVPNVPALSGITIHTAFVTLSPSAPWGINTVSNTLSVRIAP
jgi:beta-propeller repeat-containing protein